MTTSIQYYIMLINDKDPIRSAEECWLSSNLQDKMNYSIYNFWTAELKTDIAINYYMFKDFDLITNVFND